MGSETQYGWCRGQHIDCLRRMNRAIEGASSLGELLEQVVAILPTACRLGHIAAARIRFRGQVFESGTMGDCAATTCSRLVVGGQPEGSVELGYLRQPPDTFVPSGEGLLELVAERLGRVIARLDTEQTLRRSEDYYRLLADNTLDLIWSLSLDLEFTYVNPAITQIGYTPEEVIGTRLPAYCDQVAIAQIEEEVRQALARGPEGGGVIVESRLIHKDGHPVPVEVHARVLFDPQGKPVGFQGTTRDISERKQAEQQHLAMESQLRQAQKLEAVGRLAGGIAHDFNNMLSVILGHAEVALCGLQPADPLHAELQEILKAGQRSASLTRQLLAFARRQTILPRVLDLNEAVANTLSMLGRLIGEDIELVWKPGEDLPNVKIDPGQIDQLLANLVVNARDAIDGVGAIFIETGRMPVECPGFPEGEYVVLAVGDTGSGMDDETLSHIFEPFFTTKPEGKGTGLGLATVHGIVSQNDGFVKVHSQPGLGTTFQVCLPAVPRDLALQPGPTVQDEPHRTGGCETVLLVEDEPSLLRLVERLLNSLAYKVLAAGSPEQALALLRRCATQVDLVLTDMIMPGMNGSDLFNCLAELRPGLKCLFMSGYTTEAIAHHRVLEDSAHFLQKPFTRQDLATKLREAIEGTPASD